MASKQRLAALKIRAWRENPVKYVQDNFQVRPDRWQEEACHAFASKDPTKMRIALRACAGPGKSACLAWLGLNFLSCYGDKDNHPKGAAVSISADNLKDNLWAELAHWMNKSQYLTSTLQWTQSRIFAKEHKETWFLSARSFAKAADAETIGRTLSGLHAKYVLYLIDESGDIPPSIVKSAEQGLATGPIFGKMVQAGNLKS